MARCKVGDLVRYTGTFPVDNAYGWIGRVVKPRNKGRELAWEVSPPMGRGGVIKSDGREYATDWVVDSALEPIRPGEGEDETFQWAGKPEGVTA